MDVSIYKKKLNLLKIDFNKFKGYQILYIIY